MPNFNHMKLLTYLKNVHAELGHVVWPSRKTALSHTLLIILLSVLVALFVAFLDYVFTGAVGRLITGY